MTGTMTYAEYFCWGRFVNWIFIWAVSSVLCADAGYTVHGPVNHVAFSSNVEFIYHAESDQPIGQLVLQLYDVNTETGLIEKPITEATGEIVFECSYFDHAGVYVVRMLDDSDAIVAESQNMEVRWPHYTFDVPENAKTLTDLRIYAQTNEFLCTDLVYDRFEINVVLFYSGSEFSGSNEQTLEESREVGRVSVGSLGDELQAVFPCESVVKGGFYTVELESSFQNSILAGSDTFRVVVSPFVDLSFSQRSTASCVDFLNITYSTPESCNFQPRTIGVYTISPPEISLTDPSESSLELVEEVDASLGREISLPCETFANDVYTGYCFKYEGLSGSGVVLEPVVRCLPTRQLVNGGWGHWSGWGECSTSCGDSIRYRHRVCDSPAPANGGGDCEGNPVNVASCEVPKCPEYDDSFPHIVSRDVDEGSATPSSCNYVLSTSNGNLLASPQSCPSGATWVVRVANNKRIRLQFITFNLYLPQEYVRIRDGVNARAKILAFHTGQLIPDTVTSTGNQIYVEYEVFAKGKPPERGFSASYTSLDLPKSPPPTVAGALADDSSEGGLSNHSTIILAVGVSLLVLMLLLSLIMTIIIRFKEERQQFTGGNIQKIYTGPRGSFNSSTTRSNQRLFGVPGHSTTSPSEHSHQSVSKRGFPDGNGTGAGNGGDRSQMYLIPENSNMQYLPETALSPPYKGSSEIQTVSELPSPYKEETGPKWPVPKKDLSLPFHFGNPNQSMDDFSRQSEIMTDKNTIHLANKTPSEYATRGYSAHGSTRGSRSSVESRPNNLNRHKRIVAKVENSDNTSPFVSPNGELTPEGLNATGRVHKRPTRLNRSPEGAESPQNLQNGGSLTRSSHGSGYHSSDKKHRSHRSGTRSSKSGLSSDAGMYSPDSTAERSGGSKSGSGRQSKGHRHHSSHHSGNRRKSPSREEHISMKDMNSSRNSHSKRRHSPSSPRSKSKQSEVKSPRSHSSSGSGRKYRPNVNSRSPTKHGGKLYSPPTSDNSRYNSLPYTYHGTDSSLGNLSPTSDPSPIRLPKPLSMKQNRDQLKQVFISDESLMNKVASGPERSGAESSRSGVSSSRQLPTTPSSGSGSPMKGHHHARRVYSDKSLSPEEPAFDNYMPSIPGSFFENPYPQPIPNGQSSGNHGNLSVV